MGGNSIGALFEAGAGADCGGAAGTRLRREAEVAARPLDLPARHLWLCAPCLSELQPGAEQT